MNPLNTAILLKQLKESSIYLLDQVTRITEHLPMAMLEKNDGDGRWNTLQVLEHLNTYYVYYLPIIEEKIENSGTHPQVNFHPGWLGAYFTRMMQPKDGIVQNK